MSINKEWHQTHRIPSRATLAQRTKWHKAHLKFCGCRKDIPKDVANYLTQQSKASAAK